MSAAPRVVTLTWPARLREHASWAGIVAAALVVGSAGSAALPVDDHEAYVVQTAQEMRERHDWLVPHFLGEPRLNKPPLSYWIAGALAEVAGSPRVTPWQGRLPSLAGGVGVVALTLVIGRLLAGQAIGVLGGLIAASSLGFVRYAHSARPDMLYAFWCTLMLAALGWGRRTRTAERRAALLAWVAAACATLTKGPQVPVMFLAAAVAGELATGTSLRVLERRLRPGIGIPVLLAITVPWWWAVAHALGGAGLRGTQLGGSLLVPTWRHVLDPYYLYRPLALVLPSAVMLAVAVGRRRWTGFMEPAVRLLAWFVLVPALAFSLGPQRRPHYMLPALAPMSVLVAFVTRAALASKEARPEVWRLPRAVGVCFAFAFAVETGLGWIPAAWSKERFTVAALGTLAGRAIAADAPLLALRVGAPASSYYAHRPIRTVRSFDRVLEVLAATPAGSLGLLTERRALGPTGDRVEMTVLGRGAGAGGADVVLVELRSRDRSPRHAAEQGA
jgi:4-amino-4-deoxy-L-arabinose transferase-like glycosyltransferase